MDFSSRKITRSMLSEYRSPSTVKSKGHQKLTMDLEFNMPIPPCLPSSGIPPIILKPKHQLSHTWTLWYSAANRKLSWRKNQIKIFSISTIEDFWLMYNQLQPASCLPNGHTYSVFRDGILPDREEVDNRDGGKWMLNCPKSERDERFDNKWLNVLFMIMEEDKFDRLITGAEACVRLSEDRLEVWIGDVSDVCDMIEVGRVIKTKLEVDSNKKIEFSMHKDERRGVLGPKLAL